MPKPTKAQFVIGIDLGTTNSALAFVPLAEGADPFAVTPANLFGIAQVVNPGEVREEALLPSFLFLPGAADFPAGSLALPWKGFRGWRAGPEARRRESRPPGVFGEVVAVAFGRGPHGGDSAGQRSRGRQEGIAGRSLAALPGPHAERVEPRASGGAV